MSTKSNPHVMAVVDIAAYQKLRIEIASRAMAALLALSDRDGGPVFKVREFATDRADLARCCVETADALLAEAMKQP